MSSNQLTKIIKDELALRSKKAKAVNETSNRSNRFNRFSKFGKKLNEETDEDLYEDEDIELELDEEEDIEVDLASYAYQIWKNAIDAEPELAKTIPDLPDVIYATKKANEDQKINGSIVYTKTHNENDILAWVDEANLLLISSFKIFI
jgi:hypothetical protein